MATFGTYLQLGLIAVVSIFLQDLLESLVNPFFAIACDPKWPTMEGARNCLYVEQAVTWFLAVVLVAAFVTALSRGVVLGRRT